MADSDLMHRGKPSAPDMDILTDNVTIHPPLVPEQPAPIPGALAPRAHSASAPDAAAETIDFTTDPFVESADVSSRKLSPAFVHFRDAPFEFLREISRHYSGSGWRAYDNPIGQPVFYSGFTENMKNQTMKSSFLRARILDLAQKRVEMELKEGMLSGGIEKIKGEQEKEEELRKRKNRRQAELLASLEEVVSRDIDGMICKMENKKFIRVCPSTGLPLIPNPASSFSD
ncbi:hypothetical protein BGX38DRAFT_1268907 [Terfezia claveryi]|nr:hypothetical protein BGX38DRAFT_1268907 [Terfezia claveryi]